MGRGLQANKADTPGRAGLLSKPIFVVGWGHSGTTLVGNLIGHHPDVAYLNEPLRIWELDRRANVWGNEGPGSSLYLGPEDVRPLPAALIRSAFWLRVKQARRTRLAEKLPVNSFRVGYLDAMFPDARFVYVLRDPFDVAQSITNGSVRTGNGRGRHEWPPLSDYAHQLGCAHLLDLCHDRFTSALLEWRLANLAVRRSLAALTPDRSVVLRYEHLTRDPLGQCAVLERLIGHDRAGEMREFARTTVRAGATAPLALRQEPAARQLVGDVMDSFGYPSAR